MAFALTRVAAFDINSGTDATSYVSASDTPPTTGLLIIPTSSRRGAGPDTPTITAFGLTWVQIGTTIANATGLAGSGVSVFIAKAAGATPGTITVDYGSNTQLGLTACLIHVTGIDVTGTAAQAIVQAVTANDGGSAGTTGTVTMAAAGNSNNRPFAVFNHITNEASTERANWTELGDQAGGGHARSMITEWRSDAFETTASASWATASGWSGIALELKAESAGSPQTVNADAIAATTTHHQPAVTVGAVNVAANAIAATTTLHQPAITTGAVSVNVNAIAATTTVHDPAITALVTVNVNAIAATTTVHEPSVTALATIVADAIAATTTVHDPAITTGAVTVEVNAIAATTTVHEPTVQQGALTVEVNAIAATTVLHDPSVTVGAVTVEVNAIASTIVVHEPAVQQGAQTVEPDAIAATTTVHDPAVTVGAATVVPDAIEATTVIHQPALTTGAVTVNVSAIASTTVIHAPLVQTATAQTIEPNAIASTLTFYQIIVSMFTVSPDRTYTVPAENRVFVVAAENRVFSVAVEERTFTVQGE